MRTRIYGSLWAIMLCCEWRLNRADSRAWRLNRQGISLANLFSDIFVGSESRFVFLSYNGHLFLFNMLHV